VVLRDFQCDGKNWNLPLLILEVHSSPYVNSVSQTAADVIDQLRLLRCFTVDITTCVGFTFPKYKIKTCVTKVTVSFSDFRFAITLTPLMMHNVKREILSAFNSVSTLNADSPHFCFMRLSSPEILQACQAFGVMSAIQLPTKHSILLKTNNTYWKYVPRLTLWGR
jgi:hypothetical protein